MSFFAAAGAEAVSRWLQSAVLQREESIPVTARTDSPYRCPSITGAVQSNLLIANRVVVAAGVVGSGDQLLGGSVLCPVAEAARKFAQHFLTPRTFEAVDRPRLFCPQLLLEGATFTGDQQQEQQQRQVVVDLSTMPCLGMPCLTSLGESTLRNCNGVHTLVLPPTLRTVGSDFCAHSSLQHIDFSLCAGALRFVDTEWFLSGAAAVETFSTLPLLGKIGTVVGGYFLYCCKNLRQVDLSGLQGIVEIKDRFLYHTAVEELDLSALGPTCTKIGASFLAECCSLKKVTGGDGLRNVTSVGESFLHDTEKLEEFLIFMR